LQRTARCAARPLTAAGPSGDVERYGIRRTDREDLIEMLLEDGEPKLESEFVEVRKIQVA
jgi:hypothetical protein